MTWSNLTAKIYYTRDSEKMPLISHLLTHPLLYQNTCYISEVLDHSPSLSITCNHLPPTDGITTVEYKKAGSNVHLKQQTVSDLLVGKGSKPACIREHLPNMHGAASA